MTNQFSTAPVNTPVYVVETLVHQTFSCDFEGCDTHTVTEFRLEHPNGHRNFAYSCGRLSHDISAFNYARFRAQSISLFRLCKILFPNGPVERIESLDDDVTRVIETTVHYAMASGQAYCDSTTGLTTDNLSFTRELVNNEHYYLCHECSTLLAYALLRD